MHALRPTRSLRSCSGNIKYWDDQFHQTPFIQSTEDCLTQQTYINNQFQIHFRRTWWTWWWTWWTWWTWWWKKGHLYKVQPTADLGTRYISLSKELLNRSNVQREVQELFKMADIKRSKDDKKLLDSRPYTGIDFRFLPLYGNQHKIHNPLSAST